MTFCSATSTRMRQLSSRVAFSVNARKQPGVGDPANSVSLYLRANWRLRLWTVPTVFVLAVLLCGLSLPVRAAALFSFESTPGRLPKDVVPEEYDIAIVPDGKAL